MKLAFVKLGVAILATALLVQSCYAQAPGGAAGGGRRPLQQDKKVAQPTAPKADEKAYSAALKGLPNKPFDPWSGVR
jgi:hypothetical protein